MYTYASLGEKNRIENEIMKMYTFARWESYLKTKKNASGKRPPDEAHGPGDETIRPQRSSEAERSSEKKVHHARCSDSASRGCTESQNICL